MRRSTRAWIVVALAGLPAPGRSVTPIVGPPPQPAPKPFVIPPGANFLLIVSEAVAAPEDDLSSYAKVYVDGQLVGQTSTEPKSREKKWGDVLAVGNHLFRFEQWVLPFPGEWTPMQASWQPPERFVRVEPDQRTIVALKFFDGGRRHSLQVSREPVHR